MPEPTATQASRMRSTQNERPRASAGSGSALSVFSRLGGTGGPPGGHRGARNVSGAISGDGRTAGPWRDGAGCRWPGRCPRAADPPIGPHDPQRKPGTGAFALPHLTDSNSRTGTRAPVEW